MRQEEGTLATECTEDTESKKMWQVVSGKQQKAKDNLFSVNPVISGQRKRVFATENTEITEGKEEQ